MGTNLPMPRRPAGRGARPASPTSAARERSRWRWQGPRTLYAPALVLRGPRTGPLAPRAAKRPHFRRRRPALPGAPRPGPAARNAGSRRSPRLSGTRRRKNSFRWRSVPARPRTATERRPAFRPAPAPALAGSRSRRWSRCSRGALRCHRAHPLPRSPENPCPANRVRRELRGTCRTVVDRSQHSGLPGTPRQCRRSKLPRRSAPRPSAPRQRRCGPQRCWPQWDEPRARRQRSSAAGCCTSLSVA